MYVLKTGDSLIPLNVYRETDRSLTFQINCETVRVAKNRLLRYHIGSFIYNQGVYGYFKIPIKSRENLKFTGKEMIIDFEGEIEKLYEIQNRL